MTVAVHRHNLDFPCLRMIAADRSPDLQLAVVLLQRSPDRLQAPLHASVCRPGLGQKPELAQISPPLAGGSCRALCGCLRVRVVRR